MCVVGSRSETPLTPQRHGVIGHGQRHSFKLSFAEQKSAFNHCLAFRVLLTRHTYIHVGAVLGEA